MKKHFFLIAAVFILPVLIAAADNSEVRDMPIITQNTISTHDGVDYELWSQRKSDAVSMTLTGGATFKCEWDAENILFRMGKKLGSTDSYTQLGEITLEYAAEYEISRGDVDYLCVYGWTEDPLIEFYIVENHGNYKPPGGVGFQGTYEIDGDSYELYVADRVQQPSIQGTKTFKQYFGVRVNRRSEGTINISEHFKAWDGFGLDMSGKMYEIAFCVEGYKSAGSADVHKNVLKIGDNVYGNASATAEPVPEIQEAAAPAAAPKSEPETAQKSENPFLIPGIISGLIIILAAAAVIKRRKIK